MVIEPVQRREYDLAGLLKGINRKNLQSEVDFGRPGGKEAWYWCGPTRPTPGI